MSEISRIAIEIAAQINALQADALALVAIAPMDALRLLLLASELRMSSSTRRRVERAEGRA
jgi:hypothetical protein